MFDLKEHERTYYQKRNQQIANDEQVDFEKKYSCESRKIFEIANAFIVTACNDQKNSLIRTPVKAKEYPITVRC